jgi:hypothetical protein
VLAKPSQFRLPMSGSFGRKPDLREPSPGKDDTRVGHFVQGRGRRVKVAPARSDRVGK